MVPVEATLLKALPMAALLPPQMRNPTVALPRAAHIPNQLKSRLFLEAMLPLAWHLCADSVMPMIVPSTRS